MVLRGLRVTMVLVALLMASSFAADDSQQASDDAWPAAQLLMNRIGRERGFPPLTRETYEAGHELQGHSFTGSPQQVIDKQPSADLWPGQTDEGELGFDYRTADEVLYLMFDRGLSPTEIVERGYAAEVVDRIQELERQNRFKRRLMLIARLSGSAINLDREIPRD